MDENIYNALVDFVKSTKDDWNYVTPVDFEKMDKKKLFLLDIRKPEDYKKEHIKGTTNIFWLGLLDKKNLAKLPKDKKIVLICYVGHTSSQALVILKLLGYDVVSLKFGMGRSPVEGVPVAGWLDYGFETEKGRTMNKHAHIAMKVSSDLDDIITKMSNVDSILTDFGAMKVESKREKAMLNRVELECVMYTPKLALIGEYRLGDLKKQYGEAMMMQAFTEVLKDLKQSIIRKISGKMEKDPPMERVVGWKEADDYEDVRCAVTGIEFGTNVGKDYHDFFVDGRIKLTINARKMPELSEGIYNKMSDANLKKLIQDWANAAPENFWMDGEYCGSAASRVRGLMQQWRGMTPNQQQKHYNDLSKWAF